MIIVVDIRFIYLAKAVDKMLKRCALNSTSHYGGGRVLKFIVFNIKNQVVMSNTDK